MFMRLASIANLFWAIRGGGGNFGVATLIEYQLHPDGEVLTGRFVYPISKAKSVLRHFREFMATAPDELQAACVLMSHHGGELSVQSRDSNAGFKTNTSRSQLSNAGRQSHQFCHLP